MFVPLMLMLVRLEGKDPLRVTVYPPLAAPLLGDKLETEESCGGSDGPPPPGVGVGVGVGVGAQTERQDPATFTQELVTALQVPSTFVYPHTASVSPDTVRQVPPTFMYVAIV
jgi:hypothetical protein